MAAKILAAHEVAEAARILRAGGLIGFPTDTVYGIAALADTRFDSERLRAFKGGRPEPFSLHLPDVAAALKATGPLRELEEHTVKTLGPRGVTVIVAHGPADKGLGLRIVQHEVGSALLTQAAAPVVATSANLHGQPPLNDPAQIAQLPGIGAVLSAGELPQRPASAVIRMLRCGIEILRPGAMELGELALLLVRRLEFVCLGNLNRSAFARELMMAMLRYYDKALPNFMQTWAPTSTGLIGNPKSRSPEFMQKVAGEYNVSLAAHVPARFASGTPGVHIAMGEDIRRAVPDARLWPVTDPMGGPEQGYRAMAAQVRAHVDSLFARTARVRDTDAGLEADFDVLFSGKQEQP